MDKEKYEGAAFEIIKFLTNDVITTSPPTSEEDELPFVPYNKQ